MLVHCVECLLRQHRKPKLHTNLLGMEIRSHEEMQNTVSSQNRRSPSMKRAARINTGRRRTEHRRSAHTHTLAGSPARATDERFGSRVPLTRARRCCASDEQARVADSHQHACERAARPIERCLAVWVSALANIRRNETETTGTHVPPPPPPSMELGILEFPGGGRRSPVFSQAKIISEHNCDYDCFLCLEISEIALPPKSLSIFSA